MLNLLPRIFVVLIAAGTVGCADQADPVSPMALDGGILASAATQGSVFGSIRAATARFHRVEEATAAGYIRISNCIVDEGIHYLKGSLVDGVLDPAQPEHLLYEVLPNGKLRLAGVEYVIVAGLWDATNAAAPLLGDAQFMDRRLPPFGAPFPNYALFVWAWTHNPNGMYTQLNPQVSCP